MASRPAAWPAGEHEQRLPLGHDHHSTTNCLSFAIIIIIIAAAAAAFVLPAFCHPSLIWRAILERLSWVSGRSPFHWAVGPRGLTAPNTRRRRRSAALEGSQSEVPRLVFALC